MSLSELTRARGGQDKLGNAGRNADDGSTTVQRHPAGPPKHNIFVQAIRLISFVLYFGGGCLTCHAAQLVCAVSYFVNRDYFYALMAFYKQAFGVLITTMTQWWSPTKIRISGDESVRGELHQTEDGRFECDFPHRLVLIANHQLYTEWIYLWWIAYAARMHGHFYIILKESLKHLPILGPAMQLFGFIFLARNWERDRPRFQYRLQKLNTRHKGPMSGPEGLDPMWLLLFPEGTNLGTNSRRSSAKWAEKTGIRDFKHCLLPRATGLLYCLQELSGTLDYVYDCTIAYEGIPHGQFGEQLFTLRGTYLEGRPPKSVNMHWRKFIMSQIPLHDSKAFEAWLHERWQEKDDLLEHYQQTGRFPADEGKDTWNGGVSPHKVAFGAGHIETEVRPAHTIEVVQVFLPFVLVLLTFYALRKLWNLF
ncbi:MAG: hypothetical protein M1821_008985 [Bathelium mastoideum]|nr:MAG: hypothetical protein M1821_008985 [Bathelium mastoideum]KAI9684312.1 MAG: hypothetical protein M1822_005785 [Bathelium mastoideum]